MIILVLFLCCSFVAGNHEGVLKDLLAEMTGMDLNERHFWKFFANDLNFVENRGEKAITFVGGHAYKRLQSFWFHHASDASVSPDLYFEDNNQRAFLKATYHVTLDKPFEMKFSWLIQWNGENKIVLLEMNTDFQYAISKLTGQHESLYE